MTVQQRILVFGVSGVGKTTTCKEFVRDNPGYIYLRASQLIADRAGTLPERLRTAGSEQIARNQLELVEAFRQIAQSEPCRHLLLDAHAVIDNDCELVPISCSVIAALEPTRLILLEAPPEIVRFRRENAHRTRPDRSIEAITNELAEERQTVLGYGRSLNIAVGAFAVLNGFSLASALGLKPSEEK